MARAPSTAVATTEQSLSSRAVAQAPVHVAGMEYEAVQITRTVLSQKDDVPIFVICDGAIYQGEDRAAKRGKEHKEGDLPPPKLMDVTNMETGELQVIVVGVSLEDTLNEKYPDESYVGKAFRMVSTTVPVKGGQGRRVRIYNMAELRPKK